MKSVIAVSLMTFVLIFGGVAFISSQIDRESGPDPEVAAEMARLEELKIGTAAGQAGAARERERLRALRSSATLQNQALVEATARLDSLVRVLEDRERTLAEGRERSAEHLAKVYENMKPAQAAPILGALEMETILDILSRMKERDAARILASMDAGLAARISAGLSEGGRG
jgi:flagellar motility protein MotE (MotC chaperone)